MHRKIRTAHQLLIMGIIMSRSVAKSRVDPQGPTRLVNHLMGGYKILGSIGRGGTGTVYKAVHLHTGQAAAIKVLHRHLQRDSSAVARLLTEARVTTMLHHPGIVEVFGVGQTRAGITYLVMELLSGVSLARQIIPRAQPKPAWWQQLTSLRIASQLATILKDVHAARVVHRDLKPENIHLLADGNLGGQPRVKLLDFGIAKCDSPPPGAPWLELLSDPYPPDATFEQNLGTPTYMAPEQWLSCAQTSDRTDVYALGGIVFELLAGRPPFCVKDIDELRLLHLETAPEPLATLVPAVSAELSALITRMLAKSAAQRPSMTAVAHELTHHLAVVAEKARAAGPPPPTSPAPLEREKVPTAPLGERE